MWYILKFCIHCTARAIYEDGTREDRNSDHEPVASSTFGTSYLRNNHNTVQDDKPGEKSNSQIRLDDSGDDSDVSDYSTDSRETIPSVINSLHEFMYNNQGVVFDTHTSSSDIDKDSEVNSTEDVDSIACSSGTQHNYDDPHNVPMLQEKKDYFDTVTGSELNVPKQESADISPEVNLIHILKQSENETVNEMLVLTAEYQLSTDDPEFDENKTLQNCVQNKQIPETDSQLPLPPRNDEIESNECTSMDVTYSNAKDQKIPLACSTSHIFNLFSDLSLETQGQANDNLDDKLPNSVKSEEMCNSTSHSSDVSPVAVCDNTSIGAFPSSIFTKHMSFVSADDKPKVSFSFPSSTGPDLSFEINKAFSNLPASKNTFHVKTSSNSDGPFKFKISTLNNGNYSLDSVCKIMPSTSTSNIQNPVLVNSANDGASSLSFLSTLSPSASKHTETSTDMNNFQHVNSPDSRANNVSQCCQTTSQSMNTFSTTSQHHFRPFNDTFLKPDTGKCLSLFDKTPDGNSTNSFAGFSSTTTSPISSSPVFHFTNQSDIAKVLRRRAIRSPPKSAFEFCAQNNKLQISSSSGVNKNKPNFCFGSMEQQTSKKAIAETRLGSFGAGLFGDNNEPNFSIGSIEQQTNKKSNAGATFESFHFGSFEEQTSKNSTMWNAGSNFESQNTATMFKFGDTCKFPNGTFYGQRPEKFEPRSERGWTSPVCSESGDTSNKPEIPFRVARGSEVVVKNGVVKTIENYGFNTTNTMESLTQRTQTTDNSLVIEKYLNKMWKVLECPVCLEITTPPILQCEQGHHVCSNCWEKVPSCPLCKRRKSKSRNYVAEALVEKFPLPCRYRVDGCMTTVSLTEKRNHEDLCAYRTCLCLADGCNHACNFKAMTVHLKDAHSQLLSGILFCASKREKFSWTLLKPVLQSLVHAFDIPDWGLFLLRQRRALPNTYIWMEIMRFDASDTGFCYTVEASDSTQVRSITYKGLVLPLNSDTQDCLVIPRHYVNNLRHDAGFCLKISIWRSQS
ncbi:hypothetical protein C0J52_19388 [Blattella germanica]|nr:hypothetical protein C0J52_19388 [Blattella germanica]